MGGQNHFRTLEDLREKIKRLKEELEGVIACRPTYAGDHPTLYAAGEKVVKGLRKMDWTWSEDGQRILPDDQAGLSFSSTWQNLKGFYKLKEKHSRGHRPIDVYWVLEGSDLPPDMKFVPDKRKKGHYFLTVTREMTISQLVTNLQMVANRMSKFENISVSET